ncbi:MAG: EboA domain-containing protein [Planctomycetota bacterium]
MSGGVSGALRGWLGDRVDADAVGWLDRSTAKIAGGAPERTFFMAYSAAARHFAHEPLGPVEGPVDGQAIRKGWRPDTWTLCEAARTLLLLAVPAPDADSFRTLCDKLCMAADANEIVAFYKALPVLPFPEAHVARCAEGVRTNMSSVFCAVAHHSPYAAEHLDEIGWNTMVLKALFIGVALDPMDGLDRRSNPALMRMLCDYAHERWAASRSVSPELWRCVGPHADDSALADLARVLTTGDETERRAAALALGACPRPEAAATLEKHPVPWPQGIGPEGYGWRDVAAAGEQ